MRKVLITLIMSVIIGKSNAQINLYPSPYGFIQIKDDVNAPAAFIQGGANWSYFGNTGRNPLTFGNSGNYHQMVILDNGNIGIGTMSPAAKLHIGQGNQEIRFDYDGTNSHYGSLRWAGVQLGNNGQNRIIAGRSAPGGFLDFYVNNTNDGADYYTGPNGNLAMRINYDGYVGIGTTSPSNLLSLQTVANQGLLLTDPNYNNRGAFLYDGSQSLLIQALSGPGGADQATMKFQTADVNGATQTRMAIMRDGNVGIGITSPTEKLSVNGKIRSQEIKVENANWPDYVFTKDYQLPTLQQTEQHIKEKGHLPGIPSAEEVKANGIDLGEMNAKLLQKIEEQTLYLIEMKKEIDSLRKMILTKK